MKGDGLLPLTLSASRYVGLDQEVQDDSANRHPVSHVESKQIDVSFEDDNYDRNASMVSGDMSIVEHKSLHQSIDFFKTNSQDDKVI